MDIHAEIDAAWHRLRTEAEQAGYGSVVARADIASLLATAEETAAGHGHLLEPWLALTDLSIEALYATHNYALAVRESAQLSPAFAMLVGRACGMAVAIRRLVISGLDEAANVVLRSLFENLDIATVALDDPTFAQQFAEAKDSKTFWNKNIARNQIQEKAEKVIQRSGVTQPVLRDRRKRDWALLSQSTHSSFLSAFSGAAVISLATRGLIASPLGHISIRAPVILDRVAKETYDFMSIVMRLSTDLAPPGGFESERIKAEPSSHTVTGAFFTLQEVLGHHENDIDVYVKSVLPST